jgi:hypothetical protein
VMRRIIIFISCAILLLLCTPVFAEYHYSDLTFKAYMDDGTSTTSSAVGDVTLTLTNGDWDIASAKTATDYSLQMFAWTLSGTSKSNLTLTFTVDGPLTNENGSTLDYELN